MNRKRFLGMLGLCARAGKLVSGEEAVRLATAKRNARLVVIDCAISLNARDRYEALCKKAGVPLIAAYPNIGQAIGKEARMSAAVTDEGFAKALLDIHLNE